MNQSFDDHELGTLTWDDDLQWWAGSISLSSDVRVRLYIFARAGHTAAGEITPQARTAVQRLRSLEPACRTYAADQLLDIRNAEWSEGDTVSHAEFARRLIPQAVEIHETGYSEVHFGDDNLFWGHSVGVRIRAEGSFQEAVVEG